MSMEIERHIYMETHLHVICCLYRNQAKLHVRKPEYRPTNLGFGANKIAASLILNTNLVINT